MWCGTRSWLHVLLVVVLLLSGFDHIKKEHYGGDVQNEKQASGHWSELLGLFGTGMTSVGAARPPPPKSPPPKHLKRKGNADKLKDSGSGSSLSSSETQDDDDDDSDGDDGDGDDDGGDGSGSSGSSGSSGGKRKSSGNAKSGSTGGSSSEKEKSNGKKTKKMNRRGPPSAMLIDMEGVETQLSAWPKGGLSFATQPTCIPIVKTLELVNTSPDEELIIYSIKSNMEEFHPVTPKGVKGKKGKKSGGGGASGGGSKKLKKSSSSSSSEGSASSLSEQPVLKPRPKNWKSMESDRTKKKTTTTFGNKKKVLPTPPHVYKITVIFLPRDARVINATLTVETSAGGFLVPMHGVGVANVYKLHPFVGAKVPIGVPYNPPIRVTNPTGKPLNINEVFTTESFLHLDLPGSADGSVRSSSSSQRQLDGGKQGSRTGSSSSDDDDDAAAARQRSMWIVPSMATKEIIRLSFTSHKPGLYQGYVHIKTDVENLVLPVSIQVLQGGVHALPERLRPTTITRENSITDVHINLLNTGAAPVIIVGAFLSSADPVHSSTLPASTLAMIDTGGRGA